jgi:Uma2 family endonuclease
MFEVGLLDCRHRFELLDGDIVMMSPIGPDQGAMIRRLMDFFSGRLPASIACSIQLPIVVSDQSEPEPDVVLLNRRDDDYRTGHPGPSDVLLVIEVAQSSLPRDRGEKLQIYAQAAIREYWIVDIEHRGVIVHREPRAGGYRNSKQFHAPAAIAPLAAPDCQLDLAWLFR